MITLTSAPRRLSDVPEEGSPRLNHNASNVDPMKEDDANSTLGVIRPPSSRPKSRTPSLRTLGQPDASPTIAAPPMVSPAVSGGAPGNVSSSLPSPAIPSAGIATTESVDTTPITSISLSVPAPGTKRKSSSSIVSTKDRDRDARSSRRPTHNHHVHAAFQSSQYRERYRTVPVLPHDKHADIAPSTGMYWSRAPVHGLMPTRPSRAHTVTLVDSTAWIIGGWDDRDHTKGLRTVWCFDTETLQWTLRETIGEVPPPCRAHSATLYDRKIVVFGGGADQEYFNGLAILDTTTRCWSRPSLPAPLPAPRRSHTAVLYGHKLIVFGGGTGLTALNDVWALDLSVQPHKMRWEEVKTKGIAPKCRGYHTANVVGHVMIVIGGSDGIALFDDVWLLNLETREWKVVKSDPQILRQIDHDPITCKRIAHCATQVGSFLFITGGFDNTKYCSELIPFNLISLQFEKRPTYGKGPSARGYHATILADSRLFVFGGYDGATAFDEVWILELAAGAYLPQVTSFNINLDGVGLGD